MKTLVNIIILLIILIPAGANAQKGDRLVRQGNKYFDKGDYKEAEIRYLKSLQSRGDEHKGLYNLGDAFYMQNNFKDATAAFDSLKTFKMNDATRSSAYYNLGNSLLKLAKDSSQLAGQALPASIDSYKQSLLLNPEDMDAKYNLAYAQRLLKQQQQQQQNKQGQQNKDKQEQDKQQQNQQQKQDQQQDQQKQQQQQSQEQKAQQQKQQQQQAQQEQISKEDAERMLEALKNDEKHTLENLKKAQIKSMKKVRTDKDW